MTSGSHDGDDLDPSSFDEFLARVYGTVGGLQPSGGRLDITTLMNEAAQDLLGAAVGLAAERGSAAVDTQHLLWAAAVTEPTGPMLARAGGDPSRLAADIEDSEPRGQPSSGPLALTRDAQRVVMDAHHISQMAGATCIAPGHLLLAMAANPETAAGRALAAARITPEALQAAMAGEEARPALPGRIGEPGPGPGRGRTATPVLDELGRDLTALAIQGRIDPVIGRDDEIEQTVEVLSRRGKNNPVLIGEAGVGKTAIVEGIAQRIAGAAGPAGTAGPGAVGDVPPALAGRRVIQLELSGVVAGTRYRGDFEQRMKRVISEIRDHQDELIVFIDELHTVTGAGSSSGEGGIDAGSMLKPALARGELHIIGATTLDEYRKNIEKDAALARRFQPVMVPEPSPEDAIAILRGLRDRYEAHHQVRYTDEALAAAVGLAGRYITGRYLPDKAIDLIDQAGARVRLSGQPEGSPLAMKQVTVSDIAEVVSRATGIPVRDLTDEEKDRLLRLEESLHERVIGQDEAVSAVAEAVRRSRAGLGDPHRPVGSFLFLGPTGVGKTELARALAGALFGADSRMVRLDMSEFAERHTVSRLVGAPPGYVGYEEAGQLTEAVRRRPYSVVLLDEIEKAHADVFNILLQVLDDGRLTDGQGRTADFTSTVLIMTSNLGSGLISRPGGALGFAAPSASEPDSQQDERHARLMRQLRESFRPEFLNRIDEVVTFRQLGRAELRQITGLLLDQTRQRLHAQSITVQFTGPAVDWIAEHGFEPGSGARPMRRVIQREVDGQLSRLLLDGRLGAGQQVTVGVRDGQLTFTPSRRPRHPHPRPEPEPAGAQNL
ncbi:MAG TPA: ATP-dependent Clp protease ATP-binding subunit [Streptosporangiaceae bacterium]|jgi:ATP-dependent Clp protease ATP-binding subunit ClpC|nr:ATP-dependent Clp protease ATP-binding subunit [Streptosporangiaceae bacterium]